MSEKASTENIVEASALQQHYNKIFQDGFLINIHISIWGMGAQLSESDLKVKMKEDKTLPRIFKLGKKMLIDPIHLNEFKSLESRARRFLYNNSFDFHVSDAHFVPRRKLADVLLKINEFKTEFSTLVDKFVTNYPAYKDKILAEFIDEVDILKPFYPTAEKVRDKFGFTFSMYQMSIPQELSELKIEDAIELEGAHEEVKTQLRAQLQEQHNASLRQIERFTEDAAKSLRIQMVETCTGLVEKIKNKEVVSKANLNTIREEIENFRGLNFLDDKIVAAEIDKLEALINGRHDFKTDQEAITNLNNALSQVLDKAESVSDLPSLSGRYFRSIKV